MYAGHGKRPVLSRVPTHFRPEAPRSRRKTLCFQYGGCLGRAQICLLTANSGLTVFQLPTSFVRGAGWGSGRIRPNGMAPRPLAPRWLGEVPMARDANAWIDREIAGCRFADERLGRRLRALLAKMAGAMGGSIPLACQDWANTKAAYRFFSNDRVSEGEILGGHFRSTR